MKILPSFKKSMLQVVIFLFLFLFSACTSGRPNDQVAIDETRSVIETYVAQTQTANAIPADTATVRPTRTELPTWTPKPEATQAPMMPTAVIHSVQPVGPGLPWSELVDTYTGNTAAENRAPEGDFYESRQLLERPFDQSMTYLPQVDIRSAELAKDDQFIYVSILLDQAVQTYDAAYIVELDVDADGRGDYLVWADAPQTTAWQIENVRILADTNNDVGGTDVLASDAPAGGDGFDTLIFSAIQFDDPDLAWARLDPDRSGSVQIAFKPDFLEQGASFFWRVWVDAGLQNPAAYYYPDFYLINEAGSPLVNSPHYPLGTVFAVDNTCRMPFQITNSGYEPDLCGNGGSVPTSTPQPEIGLTQLPDIKTPILPPPKP